MQKYHTEIKINYKVRHYTFNTIATAIKRQSEIRVKEIKEEQKLLGLSYS